MVRSETDQTQYTIFSEESRLPKAGREPKQVSSGFDGQKQDTSSISLAKTTENLLRVSASILRILLKLESRPDLPHSAWRGDQQIDERTHSSAPSMTSLLEELRILDQVLHDGVGKISNV